MTIIAVLQKIINCKCNKIIMIWNLIVNEGMFKATIKQLLKRN